MAKGALNQLDRILHILPRAADEGGASVTELAAELEVSRERIVADVDEVLSRDHYHPASSGASVQAYFSGDRLEVFAKSDFKRPTRLSPREALAVALSLRMRVAEERAEGLERSHLRRLTSALESQATGDSQEASPPPHIHLEEMDTRDRIRDVIMEAHQKMRRCWIRYLASGRDEPTQRTIRPYLLAHGDGRWYMVAHCEARVEVRVFRFDHILEAEFVGEAPGDGCFERPADFDASAYIQDGKVHDGHFGDEVEVLYSPGISRWVREQWSGKDREDGGYTVRHRVSNARWLTQHVLRYGGEAVVVEPELYRELVSEAALRMAGGGGGLSGE